jgi:hypothetical protein
MPPPLPIQRFRGILTSSEVEEDVVVTLVTESKP